MLIKSFEGFRPRAIQREHGGWIIGYGHTLSAREGATVSEADAELLLRYDLLPVEKSVNDTVPGDLNQHQFDALVSFAFSVGVEDFAASDVRQRLNAGAPGEAADAMMGWPEPALPETALRRRAAERALFVAAPGAPVALADLLAAPLPPPAVMAEAEPAVVAAEVEEPAATEAAPASAGEIRPEPVDPRAAALAALLGEPTAPIVQPDEQPAPAETEAAPAPSGDDPSIEPAADLAVDAEPETVEPETVEPAEDVSFVASNDAAAADPVDPPALDDQPDAPAEAETEAAAVAEPAPSLSTLTPLNAARYSPYGAIMVGPLPFLQPAAEPEVSAVEPVAETQPTEIERPAAAPLTIESTPVVVIPAGSPVVDTAPVAELILTPPEEAPEPAIERPLWTPEERDAPDGSETNLFGEDLALTQGGSILRNDIEFEAPARFDWSETGPFIFMGGVGLVSFGASMAAFRRAAEQTGGSELTLIGWVLALIGLACVGVSSVNLYRRFGLPGGD